MSKRFWGPRAANALPSPRRLADGRICCTIEEPKHLESLCDDCARELNPPEYARRLAERRQFNARHRFNARHAGTSVYELRTNVHYAESARASEKKTASEWRDYIGKQVQGFGSVQPTPPPSHPLFTAPNAAQSVPDPTRTPGYAEGQPPDPYAAGIAKRRADALTNELKRSLEASQRKENR